MVRRRHTQLNLSQVVLYGLVLPRPEELMEPWLRRVDSLLEDDALIDQVFAALRSRWPQSAGRGRHGTPAEVVLRMLVLKQLKRWTYEDLEWEVKGNLVYRRFCRIDGAKVPDAKTLVRLGQLLAGPALEALFARVVRIATETGTTHGRKLRLDTTVVEAPIRYPTDSGLCEDAVRVLGRAMRRLVRHGVRLSFHLRQVKRSVSRRMREIGQALRLRGERAREAIKRPYRRLLRITGRLSRQAELAVAQARVQIKRLRGRARQTVVRLLAQLDTMLPRVRQALRQTRARVLRGVTDSPGKIVSLFEPWARIIRKGKLARPTEFGALVKIAEAEAGIVTAVSVVDGTADAPLLVPAVEDHVKLFGRAPRMVATDRGFYSIEGERQIQALGVKRAVIPKPGHRSQARILYEKQRWFRRGRGWRAGGEARISRLKHRFGMARSRYRGESGLKRSVYWAAMANNLVAIATKSA